MNKISKVHKGYVKDRDDSNCIKNETNHKEGYLVLKSQFQDKEIEYLNYVIQNSKQEMRILLEELEGKVSRLKKNNKEKEYLQKLEETVDAKNTYIADMKNTLDNYKSIIKDTVWKDSISRPIGKQDGSLTMSLKEEDNEYIEWKKSLQFLMNKFK